MSYIVFLRDSESYNKRAKNCHKFLLDIPWSFVLDHDDSVLKLIIDQKAASVIHENAPT